jgi:hypothetical protein
MPILKQPPLNAERIKALHDEIETFIDALVEKEASACPGIPAVRIKHDLIVKAGGCSCRVFYQNSEKA